LVLDNLGYRVFAGVRRERDGDALKQRASGRVTPILIDVTKPDLIASASDLVRSQVGAAGLAGLVNNAGIVVAGPLETLPLAALRTQFEVNLLGQLAVTQAFLPLLRQGRGRVVNMGSISGRLALPLLGPYAASKSALESITNALRLELREWAIPVTIVEPGTISTPIWEKSGNAANEIGSSLSSSAQALYRRLISAAEHTLARAAKSGIPPERVARVVARALVAKRPRTHYLVGRDARVLAILARLLPARVRDRLILGAFRC
jgi:NAD(P)-dependent dehydrogenase (short-subunit alcohol dehydrogenase family)